MVHHLAGEAGDADASIEARRAEPERESAPVLASETPEPDMMAPARAAAGELLEREILRPAPRDEVRAHRGRRIGSVEEDAAGVAQTGRERDSVGGGPAGGAHREDELAAGSDERQVDRIRRDPFGGVREPGKSGLARQPGVPPPDRGHHDVGERRVGGQGEREKEGRAKRAGGHRVTGA